jgi:hypothetical protein
MQRLARENYSLLRTLENYGRLEFAKIGTAIDKLDVFPKFLLKGRQIILKVN